MKTNKKISLSPTDRQKEKDHKDRKTKVESNTGKRPEKDTNPLPPNPNKVDNHDD